MRIVESVKSLLLKHGRIDEKEPQKHGLESGFLGRERRLHPGFQSGTRACMAWIGTSVDDWMCITVLPNRGPDQL